jgi:hypothetical protein
MQVHYMGRPTTWPCTCDYMDRHCEVPETFPNAVIFSFILFKSALHVSGDKFATAPVGSSVGALYSTKSCIYSQKVLLRMGEFVARNM